MQAVDWLCELLDALLKTHVRLGDDAHDTKALMDKHKKFVDVAQVRPRVAVCYCVFVRACICVDRC